MFKRWKYRVRDCQTKMVGKYQTLEEVYRVVDFDTYLRNILEAGFSISDGNRYKVDVRGSYYDSTWSFE